MGSLGKTCFNPQVSWSKTHNNQSIRSSLLPLQYTKKVFSISRGLAIFTPVISDSISNIQLVLLFWHHLFTSYQIPSSISTGRILWVIVVAFQLGCPFWSYWQVHLPSQLLPISFIKVLPTHSSKKLTLLVLGGSMRCKYTHYFILHQTSNNFIKIIYLKYHKYNKLHLSIIVLL